MSMRGMLIIYAQFSESQRFQSEHCSTCAHCNIVQAYLLAKPGK
jgi:hypothetical protein